MKPSRMLRNELRLARHGIAHVAQLDPLPDVDELPELLLEVVAEAKSGPDMPKKLHRTAVGRAATTFALAYCWDYLPAGWTYAGSDVRAAANELQGPDRRAQVCHPVDPRVSWWTDENELVIDQIHGTHLGDGLLDDWMRARLRGDLIVGEALAGNRFAGVRLCSLRAVNASVLITSLTDIPTPLFDTPYGAEGGMLR